MASLGGTPSQNSAIDINFKNENSEISPKNNEFKEKFNLQLANFYNEQIGTVKKPWTIDRVAEVTHHIITGKEAQAAGARRTSTQYYWTSKYDVISIETEDVLIMKKKTPQDPTVQIVPIENYFDLLFTVHHKLGHGARDKMLNYIKKKFYVQKKAVEIFLSLCTTCEVKRNMPRKGAASRLATPSSTNSPNDFNNRGQVDLIDLQTTPDGEFKWLLMYQDHSTQFIQLRPLRSNQASEVATELVKIYLIFGAPFVLQSNNGQEFTAKVIEEIMNLWPNCTITHGGSRHPQTREKAENNTQEVTNTLHAWMRRNKSSNWAMGCHFVQYEKNVSFCKSVGSTPYHALLGCDPKSEQESPNISLNIEFIKTEEDEQISTQNNGMEVNSLTSANTVYTDIKEERHSDNESESSPESEYEQQDLTKVIHEPSVVKRETICFDPVSVKLESADLTQDPCVSVKKEPGSIVPGLMEPECVVQEGRAHDVTDPASSAASADSLTSEIHACSECPKTYNKPWLLRAHMRIHTGEKPYQCSMCAKRFTNNRDLKKHERVHTGEKPYSCGTCGKRFTNSHQLKVHVRIHTGEKPYRCGVCQKQFTQLATLQKHERTHTGERPYGCPLCEKSYASSSHLKRHSQVHEKLKPDQGRYRAGVIETEVLLGGFEFGLEEPAPEATPV